MKTAKSLLLGTALSLACGLAGATSYGGLFVFGDSISDSGNRAADVGVSANQVISGNSYFPTRPFASGTYSNGPVWAQGLADRLGLPALLPSAQGGGNFAYAFASVGEASTLTGQPYSLPTQLNQYLTRAGGSADPSALYVLAGGANDLFDLIGSPLGSPAVAAATSRYATTVGAMVDSLQVAGAQHIVVWNVPNLGVSPGVRSFGGGLDADASLLAQGMNAALAQRLAGEGPGVRIFDIYGLWTDWAAGGTTAGGFANTSDACGAPSRNCDPASALFWDAIHPTAAGHAAMAAVLQAQLAPVPEPASAALFAVGLGGLLWLRRRGGFSRPS